MTFVASCVQPAGISTSFCSNISLPLSSLIWAERSSHCTESNGLSSSAGQNSALIFRPFERSRRPSILAGRAGETGRDRGALAVAMSQLLAKEAPRNRGCQLPANTEQQFTNFGSGSCRTAGFPPFRNHNCRSRPGTRKGCDLLHIVCSALATTILGRCKSLAMPRNESTQSADCVVSCYGKAGWARSFPSFQVIFKEL